MIRLFGLLLLTSSTGWADETACPSEATELHLEARAEQAIANDTLHARLVIEREGEDAAVLAEEVNRLANAAMQAAKGQAALRLVSGGYGTQPVYAPKTRAVERWRVRHELLLSSKDFPAAMRFIARQQEVMALGGLTFAVSAEIRATAETRLMQEAVRNLQARAEALRQTLDQPKMHLRRVDLQPQGAPALRPMMRAALAAEAEAVPPLENGAGESTLAAHASGIACISR
ncbi:MAG: SIMPL domain-containing protein [Pseudomonadota bacterium]